MQVVVGIITGVQMVQDSGLFALILVLMDHFHVLVVVPIFAMKMSLQLKNRIIRMSYNYKL